MQDNKFNVGDKVRIVQTPYVGSHHVGDEGVIANVHGGDGYTVRVEDQVNPELHHFGGDLEKIEEVPHPPVESYSVGDKVQLTSENGGSYGADRLPKGIVGEITEVKSALVRVRFVPKLGLRTEFPMWPCEITPVKLPTEEPLAEWERELPGQTEDRLKEGDRVRVTDEDAVGVIGIDDGADEGDYPFRVDLEDGGFDWYNAADLEKIGEKPRPKVGDRVRVKPDGWSKAGEIGTLREDDKTMSPFLVTFEGDEEYPHGRWYSEDNLEVVEPEPEPEPEYEINEGDSVRLTGENWHNYGKFDEVTTITRIERRHEDGSPAGYLLEGVGSHPMYSSTGRWELTKVEPKPERKLEVGARVRVNADHNYITGHGNTGTIRRSLEDPRFDWAVNLDGDNPGHTVAYYARELELIDDEPEPFEVTEEKVIEMVVEAVGREFGESDAASTARSNAQQALETFFSELKAQQYNAGWEARQNGYERGVSAGGRRVVGDLRQLLNDIERDYQ